MSVVRNGWLLLAVAASVLAAGCAAKQKTCDNPGMVLVPSPTGFIYVPACGDAQAAPAPAEQPAEKK